MSADDRISTRKWCLAAGFAIHALAVHAAEPGDIGFVAAASLPQELIGALAGESEYAYETRINPFYLQGDFNGDGRRDTVVLVRNRKSGKHGIAVALRGRKSVIVGAGNGLAGAGDDFDWMDAWYVQPEGPIAQGAADAKPPRPQGDVIVVMKTEASSGIVWWDGKTFRWYQQGD